MYWCFNLVTGWWAHELKVWDLTHEPVGVACYPVRLAGADVVTGLATWQVVYSWMLGG